VRPALGSPHAGTLLLALLVLLCCSPARADRGTEQVALAASGRYDQLEQMLEAQLAKGPLDTRDRHALCYAYSKTKRYARLMACLDQLAVNLARGDKSTRLFALDDATPALGLMRSEAQLELGQYAAGAATARETSAWLAADRSDDLDMVFNAMAAEAVALSLAGERAPALLLAKRLAGLGTGTMGAYASAKAMALARVRMALGDYAGVLAAFDSDKMFAVNVFLDRLISGGFLTGVNNWVWAELPRAFMVNKALLETGRGAEAKAGFDRLLGLRQVAENGEIYWLLLSERGRIAEREQDRAGALAWYGRAIDVVEQQRASINTEASKIGFVGDKQALYGRAIACALALGVVDRAYDYMERAKSRALVDLLAGKGAHLALTGRDAASSELLTALDDSADAAQAQLPLDMARAGAAETRAIVQGHAQALRKRDPALASLVSVGALSLPEVRRFLRPDEVLIEYYVDGAQLVVVGVGQTSVISATLDAAPLEREVREFRSAIEGRKANTKALAQALYTRLLGPVAGLIAGRSLVIVPHASLHYLPFAALHDGSNYLAASHNMRYLPSASVHQYLRKHDGTGVAQMLVIGNPDLGNPQLDLPSAEAEAKMIAKLVPESRLLTRLAASETVFKQTAGSYRYLHVAAHGEFVGDTPLQSRLALAADAANDGNLSAGQNKKEGLRQAQLSLWARFPDPLFWAAFYLTGEGQ
jgi:CHAT domain-containing protein